ESFESKHHPRLDSHGLLERNQAADHRLLPDGEADTVAVLQSETGFFVRETELLRLRPDSGDFCCGAPWPHELDSRVQILAAALVGINHRVGSVAHSEAAVVAGAVSHVGMQNVVVDGIAGPQHAI